MARNEQPKEDLLRDATALVERIELHVDESSIVIGFRPDGAASLFFDAEPVYHFNAADELRRAYDDGLVKASDGQLIRMKRERSDESVQLISSPFSAQEHRDFLADLASRCNALLQAIDEGSCHVTGQVSSDVDFLRRVKNWLSSLPHPISVAARPHVND